MTAIEGCIDAAQHVCAAEGWGPPEDNGHAMRILAEHGVYPPELGESMSRAVGFRNLLVHGYRDVDHAVVVANLSRLSEFERFVADVSALAG